MKNKRDRFEVFEIRPRMNRDYFIINIMIT